MVAYSTRDVEVSDTSAKTKWYASLTDWVLAALLLVEGLLFLSDQYDWFAFNRRKGWTVLIAAAIVGGTLLLVALGAAWSWAASRWTNRKPFQFGLRPAMLAVAVVGVVCGWFASAWKEAREQRMALAEVSAIAIRSETEVDSLRPGITPLWLSNLLGEDFFTYVVEVQLGESDLSDALASGRPVQFGRENLKALGLLPRLRRVILLNMQLDREQMKELRDRGILVESFHTW